MGKASKLKQQRKIERQLIHPTGSPDTVVLDLNGTLDLLRRHGIDLPGDDLYEVFDDVPFIADPRSPSGYRLDVPAFVERARRIVAEHRGTP